MSQISNFILHNDKLYDYEHRIRIPILNRVCAFAVNRKLFYSVI